MNPTVMWWALVPVSLVLVNALLVALMLRRFAKPTLPPKPELVGERGTALTPISSREGKVRVGGRTLLAIAEEPIEAGNPVTIVQIEGLVAKVVADVAAKMTRQQS